MELIPILFLLFVTIFGVSQCAKNDVPDIRNFEENPYCETSKVNNKEFKRCLKAIEVDEKGVFTLPSIEQLNKALLENNEK